MVDQSDLVIAEDDYRSNTQVFSREVLLRSLIFQLGFQISLCIFFQYLVVFHSTDQYAQHRKYYCCQLG